MSDDDAKKYGAFAADEIQSRAKHERDEARPWKRTGWAVAAAVIGAVGWFIGLHIVRVEQHMAIQIAETATIVEVNRSQNEYLAKLNAQLLLIGNELRKDGGRYMRGDHEEYDRTQVQPLIQEVYRHIKPQIDSIWSELRRLEEREKQE